VFEYEYDTRVFFAVPLFVTVRRGFLSFCPLEAVLGIEMYE